MANVNKILIRMYRIGTGDFFLLQFKKAAKVTYNVMIDCGCIAGGKADFIDKIENLKSRVNGVIDLLIVTHEHADHINGFEKCADIFDKIDFKEVWFAWTEEDEPYANRFRKEHSEIKLAISAAIAKLTSLMKSGEYDKMYGEEYNGHLMLDGKKNYIEGINHINSLNYISGGLAAGKIPTMEDILRKHKVIKDSTVVRFWEPGQVIEDIKNAEGIRFFVLGPPKSNDYIKMTEKAGEGYEKREKPSTTNFAFINAFDETLTPTTQPFNEMYSPKCENSITNSYTDKDNNWRNIDNDWLLSAGALALRHERSINNTSLALAIQFTGSERVLLFPGDAEHGNWLSWHDNLEWKFKDGGKTKKVNAEYILNNTVFYKVGHHLSNNGTIKQKGLDMMTSEEFAAMATLDFRKIMKPGWLNTMPNDIIGAELIRKTGGKMFFVGERAKILKNIKTNRVNVSKKNLDVLEKYNKPFDGEFYIDYEVKA